MYAKLTTNGNTVIECGKTKRLLSLDEIGWLSDTSISNSSLSRSGSMLFTSLDHFIFLATLGLAFAGGVPNAY
jgi:hypothetical protein